MERTQVESIIKKYRDLANSDKVNSAEYTHFADYIEQNKKVFEAECYESEADLWDYYKGRS